MTRSLGTKDIRKMSAKTKPPVKGRVPYPNSNKKTVNGNGTVLKNRSH